MQAALSKINGIMRNRNRFYVQFTDSTQIYLTTKEFYIVRKLTTGRRAKEIAWELGASLHTINTHLANIKDKLGCENIFQLGYLLGKHLPEAVNNA
jgi:DNA-binding CsgD family transcriptional regulator